MAEASGDKILFGLVSQGRADRETALSELLVWLSVKTGLSLSVSIAPSYETLAKEMEEEKVHVAWLPPLVYVRLERKQIVTPLLTLQRNGAATYQAVLVVRDDAPIAKVEDLRGKKAVWVDPLSASGYVLPRAQLRARGIDPSELFENEHFAGSHGAALAAVRSGEADVTGTHGAAAEDGKLLQNAKDERLRVLETFSGIPADVIAALKSLGEDKRDVLARGLVSAGDEEATRDHVRTIFGAATLRVGSEAAYAGWHRSLPAALASGLLVAIDDDGA